MFYHISEVVEEVVKANRKIVQKIWIPYLNLYFGLCPYCEMELQYLTFFKNGNNSFPICGKYFTTKDDQGNSQMQSQKVENELGYYKESNKKLQIKNNKEKYFSD